MSSTEGKVFVEVFLRSTLLTVSQDELQDELHGHSALWSGARAVQARPIQILSLIMEEDRWRDDFRIIPPFTVVCVSSWNNTIPVGTWWVKYSDPDGDRWLRCGDDYARAMRLAGIGEDAPTDDDVDFKSASRIHDDHDQFIGYDWGQG